MGNIFLQNKAHYDNLERQDKPNLKSIAVLEEKSPEASNVNDIFINC